ncbi:hypothetical protein T02_2748 [Trichinella nativa]|uniref:Uncharacterized protein n=1 Tax=Trichinella nativa TaxID=6335 RepID=A0A0V1LD46_9BILA|nr:hypothetical protein T02_2748 [Trichinella nativa]
MVNAKGKKCCYSLIDVNNEVKKQVQYAKMHCHIRK